MKRDFNCYHVHSGFSPLKPAGTDTRSEESCVPNYDDEFCKDCAKEHQRRLHNNLHHGSPKNVSIKTEGKPVHNKENQQVWRRVGSANEMDNQNEDSGYSSMLGNQHELTQHDDTLPLAGNLIVTPNHNLSQKKHLLPVLHFEKLVCSTLKKTSKRNPKSWAALLDKMVSRGSIGFTNLIGRKMGIDRLDILGELFHKEYRHLLTNILRHLSDMDLINVAKVSTTWKKILQDDKWAFQIYSKALKYLSNSNSCKQADTRGYVLHREALTLVQKVGTIQNSSSKKVSRTKVIDQSTHNISSYSRHTQFSEVAKTLKNTESLKVCHRCGSPSKYDSHLHRAICIRESCGFDFCTKCLCTYHSAKDCATGKPLKSSSRLGPLPGTKKSKQNLQRL
ncbi:F-box only protein 5 [Hemicordylus capensis]|uniref:F-box only protein 5 n=1 Tax=Hemicordylus capensis TaxID=884348 RepID=UPI00230215FA|nr:F-box only protein 5 [Hemicordylus capensis]